VTTLFFPTGDSPLPPRRRRPSSSPSAPFSPQQRPCGCRLNPHPAGRRGGEGRQRTAKRPGGVGRANRGMRFLFIFHLFL
jgi:hypothetical protein